MVDQVSPLGSLGPGLPQTTAVASRPQPVSDNSRPASPQAAASPSPATDGGTAVQPQASLEEASHQVNAQLQQLDSNLKMHVDKASGTTVYQIVSKSTGEVLLQVPSQDVLSMAQKLIALTKNKGAQGSPGVLVDKEG